MGGTSNEGRIRILILDDDEDDIFLVSEAITEAGRASYDIMVAHEPSVAAQILREHAVDIVLCDYLLGATTGIDFITSMRAEGLEVPIILLTGVGNETTDNAALAAGASDFLSKESVTPDVIDRAIRYSIANAERKKLLQTVLSNVNAAVALISHDHRPSIWNPNFAELAKAYAEAHGRSITLNQFARIMASSDSTVTVCDRVLDKKITEVDGSGSSVMLLHDVTEHVAALREREAAENRAAHLAMNCSLTGLPNRNAFSAKIDEEIKKAKAEGYEFYLLNLDVDKLKSVNDIYGHSVGDSLLRDVAQRLSSCCGPDDFIARLGGDEFMAIQKKPQGSPEIPDLARRMADQFVTPFTLDELVTHSGISIGIAVYPHHGDSAEELMSNADVAMYRAKADPLRKIYAFNNDLDTHIRQTRQIAQDLRHTIEDSGLQVHFQPQADMIEGRITGFEALARWNHPKFGAISPGQFVPIAEENGLITRLGEFVLTRACETAASWPEPVNVAVNISPVQILHVDLARVVQETLIKTGLPPSRLELEVTESVLIHDTARALHVLRGIKNLGVSIALDDFGTGYSSLSTMISFPFDKIKIDRSFIRTFKQNHQAAVVTRTMIGMAQQLDYRVIAEGVENTEHVDFLIGEGCREMQGFLIGRPDSEDRLVFSLDDHPITAKRAKSA